jgi:hypothetical protein
MDWWRLGVAPREAGGNRPSAVPPTPFGASMRKSGLRRSMESTIDNTGRSGVAAEHRLLGLPRPEPADRQSGAIAMPKYDEPQRAPSLVGTRQEAVAVPAASRLRPCRGTPPVKSVGSMSEATAKRINEPCDTPTFTQEEGLPSASLKKRYCGFTFRSHTKSPEEALPQRPVRGSR